MRKTMNIAIFLSIMAMSCSIARAQSNGSIWSQTIQRALDAQGIKATAVTDIQNGAETLHLTIDGKTVAEPVTGDISSQDYSSTIYVVIDGIESRMRYMYPVTGTVASQIRPADNPGRTNSRQPARPAPEKYTHDPLREWHSRSTMYKPDDVFDDLRDLDLLEITLENAVSKATRVRLIDPAYAKSVPVNETLLLLRARVIDLQRGLIYEVPKEGEPQPKEPKIVRKLAYANVDIQLIDDATGQVVWQSTISDDDNTSFMSTDPMDGCLKHIASSLTKALDNMYPSTAPRLSATGLVTAISAEKKEKANEVFINMGSAQELVHGDNLVVYLEQTVGGNTGLTQIGTLTVSEVQGPSLSLCKVHKGEKDIYAAIQSGKTLVVKTAW